MPFIEPVLQAVFPGRFYPRLVYNGVTLDFEIAKSVVVTPKPVRAQSTTLSGVNETLYIREELIVVLSFGPMSSPKAGELLTYVRTWAFQGKQAVLTLDRFNTCAGQLEYDQFNGSFTKAELLNDPLSVARFLMAKPLYAVDLTWRQGQ